MFFFWLGNWKWFRSSSRWSYVSFPLNKLEKAVSWSQKTLVKAMVPVKQAPEWIFPGHSDSTDSTAGTDLVSSRKPGIQALSTICWKWKLLSVVWLQDYSPFSHSREIAGNNAAVSLLPFHCGWWSTCFFSWKCCFSWPWPVQSSVCLMSRGDGILHTSGLMLLLWRFFSSVLCFTWSNGTIIVPGDLEHSLRMNNKM